ncbi:MAG: DUF2956 domain-containing protein [Methylotetracoccus sp.]|nr:DUF2956 domain-containing protein [Methylotetracoccus sp.]
MTEKRTESFQQQGEQTIEAEALQVARRIQTPGQTKEQTKLMARGIAKGIAQYKKQQSEKARERERARKKLLKQRVQTARMIEGAPLVIAEAPAAGNIRAPLWTAGTLFTALGAFHLWRFLTALPITLGHWPVPVWWSLPAAVFSGGLAVWLFLAGSTRGSRASN